MERRFSDIIKAKETKLLLLFVFCFVYELCFSLSTSFLLPRRAIDSHMFQELGLCLLHGKLPYIDLFDHKGFYLFLINAIGLGINHKWGLILLQAANLFGVLVISFKSMSLIVTNTLHKKWLRMFVMICIMIYGYAYQSGNMSEDWSLLAISFPLYWSLLAIKEQTYFLSKKILIAIGTCVGIVFFIRPNNIFPIFGFLSIILYHNVRLKKLKYIFQSLSLIILGFSLALLPCILFYYIRGGWQAVDEMFYGTITSNLIYSQTKASSLAFKAKSYALVIFFLLLTCLYFKRDRELVLGIILCYLFGFIIIGAALYRHYFLIFIPLLPLTAACLWNIKKRLVLLMLIGIAIFSVKPFMRYYHYVTCDINDYRKQLAQFNQIVKQIPEKERQQIWNYNLKDCLGLLISQDIVQSNRFFLLYHINILERYTQSERHKFGLTKPKWVLIEQNQPMYSFDYDLIQQQYIPVDSTEIPSIQENITLLINKDYLSTNTTETYEDL